MPAHPQYSFDGFRLIAAQRLLLSGGRAVKLGSRAFDLLHALVVHRERVVAKHELLDWVWPGQDVGEANLAVHVMALRKLLGPGAIATVPGRGYRFTRPVAVVEPEVAGTGDEAVPHGQLPARPDGSQEELLGRAADAALLEHLLERHALVSVVGPGGVGKTRLAQHVGLRLQGRAGGGPWWVELAALSGGALVAVSAARVLHVALPAQRSAVDAVAGALRASPGLLILDNGEHVADGVAALAAAVLRQAPGARLLVTSQEPLGVPAEQVMRLRPLALPQDDTVAGARDSGAVALFEARARRQVPLFRVQAENRACVVEICRRLDGMPLAIELAAARLPLLGLEGLRARLDARLQFLTGHRAGDVARSLPRHEALRATLDWSHGLLDAAEQRLLRRLAVFAGGFTLQAAQLAAQDDAMDEWAVLRTLGSLVDKSMVVSDNGEAPRFRLLESTRLYALERLDAAGEHALQQERHARAMEQLLRVPADDHRLWRTPPPALPALADEIDNARAALEWAQTCADDALVIPLAAGASHVFLAASLNAEYLQRVLPLGPRAEAAALPPPALGLFWARIALAAARSAHPAGLDAALRAAAVYRALGDAGRLYDALTWTLAIASRHAGAPEMQAVVDEAVRLEQPGWPPALRSSFQWARHRWLLAQGRAEEALACAQRQAELLAEAGLWATHVAVGANVADCELSLGHLDRAEALARGALQALDEAGIDDNLVGHVLDMLMVALTLQRRAKEAVEVGRRARRLLQREGDEARLLDTLALNATTLGRWPTAARIAGAADAALSASGERRWPASAARRQQLEQALSTALAPEDRARLLAEGAALGTDQALGLAFADGAV